MNMCDQHSKVEQWLACLQNKPEMLLPISHINKNTGSCHHVSILENSTYITSHVPCCVKYISSKEQVLQVWAAWTIQMQSQNHYQSCIIVPPLSQQNSCLAYSLTLKMKVVHFSNTFVIFYQAPCHHIPHKTALHHFVNLNVVTCLHFKLSAVQIWDQSATFPPFCGLPCVIHVGLKLYT
jgi:hypothetical protein